MNGPIEASRGKSPDLRTGIFGLKGDVSKAVTGGELPCRGLT